MNMIKTIVYFIFLYILLSVFPVSLNATSVCFKRYSVSNGLSQSTVLSLTQDHTNKMWVGTMNGLNWFDGYRFVSFFKNVNDSTSLSDNCVYALCTDEKGLVWAGTATGLSRYNIIGNNFTNYYVSDKYTISILAIEDLPEKNSLLLSTDMGLVVFNKQDGTMNFISRLRNIAVHSSCRVNEHEILLGTVEGTWIYNSQANEIRRILPSLQNDLIVDVLYDKERHLYWVASQGNGLYCVNEDFQIQKHYKGLKGKGNLNTNQVKVLWLNKNKDIWIGSMDGLFILNVERDYFEYYNYSYDDDSSLGHNSVRSIFQDEQGGVWVGTYCGGLCYYHPMMPMFEIMRHSIFSNSLSNNTVNCIVEDPYTKRLWIGTNDGGLNCYDRNTRKYTYFMAGKGANFLQSNNIKDVLVDKNKDVYVATVGGGLNCIYANGHIEYFMIPNAVGGLNSCYNLLEGDDKTLWVGTSVGLYLFDYTQKRLIEHPLTLRYPQLSNTVVRSCYRNTQGEIWICTDKKLYLYDGNHLAETKYLTVNGKYENISAWAVLETQNHEQWIASTSGLYKYQNGKLTLYTTANGLLDNYASCLLEDERGRLWITTNKGISCFTPHTSTFQNYTQQDGLSSNQFNQGGACKTYDGYLFLGSLNGITSFKPSDWKDNPLVPQPIITDFSILGRPITAQDKEEILLKYTSNGSLIGVTFPSEMKLFSINFTAINYLSCGRNSFAYRLKGFSDEWIYLKGLETLRADYSNLPPGKYVFQVKACNDIGQWNKYPTDFLINITPMWYETWWFKFFILISVLGVIVFFVYYKIKQAKMQMQLELEYIKREKVEELSQEKVRFYINISHELRTPLSLILAPLEELMEVSKTWDNNIRKKLNYVYRSSHRLLHIVNQLLEFRKAETGLLALNVSIDYVDKIVYGVFEMFQEKAKKQNIAFCFKNSLEGMKFPVDKMYMETIVMNLLSNAFKFTPMGKTIEVEIFRNEENYYIRIKDTGIGISKEKQERIFERFYQIDDARKGSGIGLSLVKCLVDRHHGTIKLTSELNCFTEFQIAFPIDDSIYQQDELSCNQKNGVETITEKLVDFDDNFELTNGVESSKEEKEEEDHLSREYTLLLVDDNQEMLSYLKECFEPKYHIQTATNGENALNILKLNKIDLILSDVMMPGINGVKLCQLVKRSLQTCHIPFILLSAKGDIEAQEAGVQMGADDYIPKPFSVSLLMSKIANVLKMRERYIHYYISNLDLDSAKVTSNSIDEEFISKAVQIAEANLSNENFSIDDLAEQMCVGRTTLYNKMNAILGEAPANFIRRIRLNKACKMILEGRLTIAEISIQTGFSSPSYFSSSFKKYVGCLPSEYVGKERKEIL